MRTPKNPTVRDVRRAVEAAGGTLEEDEGYRDMKVLQACAPEGKKWAVDEWGLYQLRIDWATGNSPTAIEFRRSELRDLIERLECGLMTDPDLES